MARRRSLDLGPAILAYIRQEQLALGARLFETQLALRFEVSRAPVRSALQRLAEAGVVAQDAGRGFVLQQLPPAPSEQDPAGLADDGLYYTIASDHFDGLIPETVSELELLRRYGGSVADLRLVLSRIAAEGWAERQKGYGWRFLEVLRRPDAYAQIMRLRRALEPIGLLEPTFSLDDEAIARLRARQQFVLDHGLDSFSAAELFQEGCEFHEIIAAASGNVFLLESLRRFNALRRLFFYRAVIPGHEHLGAHVREHLQLLDLIERGEHKAAAEFLERHMH